MYSQTTDPHAKEAVRIIDDDKLPAVRGLASLIEQSTGEAYLYGLWKSRLSSQLLWIVTGALQHRESPPINAGGVVKDKPPSWSWASIAPGRKIVMPKQASYRAQFKTNIGQQLHLKGRTRMLTKGLSPIWAYPEEEQNGVVGPRYPMLEHQPNIWAIDYELNRILVCLDWRRPIIIHLDRDIPSEDSFDELVCFQVNYIGFLVLEPPSVTASGPQVFRRIGCAQVHRESTFFHKTEDVDVIIE